MALFGISLYVWIITIILFLCGIGIYFLAFQSVLKKYYYMIRCPEKLIKIVMHYEGGKFRNFYKIIPDTKFYSIQKKRYYYASKYIIEHTDSYISGDKVIIDGKTYSFDKMIGIRPHRSRYIEIHYYYNDPAPILFDPSIKTPLLDKKGKAVTNPISPDISGFEFEAIYKNDLFIKLLTLKDEKNLMQLILFLVVANMLLTAFLVAKTLHFF